jgi:hypothetical protein
MLTSHRRPDAPPPPKPVSTADPLAQTTQEWREAEREKAAARTGRLRLVALALSLPFLAGGVYAFPLVYLWRVLCVRVPVARRWGVAWAVPALACAYLFPQAVLGPTRALLLLPVTVGTELPVLTTVPLPLPGELGLSAAVPVADPFPPLRGHLTASWRTGLVWAALLAAGWGVGGLLEGARLKPRSAREVVRAAQRGLKTKPAEIERGLMLRGYIAILFAKQGTGKTEYLCWLVLKHPEIRFYFLTEQTDATLAPYLLRWGLVGARNLHIVTRDDADALWRAHGHQTAATWEHLGPMVLDDAGRRGADVWVMDTWTAWTGGTQDAKGIQAAMSPIREAVGRWHYAAFVVGHTNAEGLLLGSKEFERLCDISVGGEVVEGTEVRRLTWVKDRSPGRYPPGQSLHLIRDLNGPAPRYLEVAPGAVSGGGVGGVIQVQRDSNRSPTALERVLTALGEGPSTVAELREETGLSQPAVSGALTELEAKGGAIRIGKRGKADLWRIGGKEDGDGAADVSVQAG